MESARQIFTRLKCLLLAQVLFLAGCFVPIKYDASVPLEIPSGFEGKISEQTISLDLPELILSAQIQAYDWDGQYLRRPLGVWIELNPKNGWVKFDPQYVTLKTDEEDELSSVSFLGPSNSWHSPRALAAGCGPRRFHSGIAITNIGVSQEWVVQANNEVGIYRPTVGPVFSEGKKCFMFWFDTDPMPVHTFVLSVGGITVDENKVPVPKILFQNGSLTTFRGIP
ncbi:MAG: hypothetical protein OEO19_09935 [Gammaproteobacteria bacterium]|nr:hypothetical protein [Gammaproteobacteria bacterium]MDH3450182.1 hypothetical protein [Gammaproteobacteria bacterium]